MDQDPTAVVLLSGGLDSITVLAHALDQGEKCLAVNFHYGQKHDYECACAQRIAQHYSVILRTLSLPEGIFAGSALTDEGIEVATDGVGSAGKTVPRTYVPMRNSIFLSVAAAIAESESASRIYIGANHMDYSGYPDCRPLYLEAMQKALNLGCAKSETGQPLAIVAPLLEMRKSEIITHGISLGVDYSLSSSCYQCRDDGAACGLCDACRLRLRAFADLNLNDPIRYIDP